MSDDILIKLITVPLGFCGFWVARYIYKHKKHKVKPLLCPLKLDCHGVVNSDYSRFLGIPVEILGMFYYALVFVGYLVLIFMSDVLPFLIEDGLVAASLMAFVFSVYLIWVQIFILRKGCFWCFVSAIVSTLIFILASI